MPVPVSVSVSVCHVSHDLLQRLLRRFLQDVRSSASRNTDNTDNTDPEDVRASAPLSDAHAQGGAAEADKGGAAEALILKRNTLWCLYVVNVLGH